MKKVSFSDIKKARWAVPAGIVALGAIALAVGQPANQGSKAAVTGTSQTAAQDQNAEAPAHTSVNVNGTNVPTDKNGSTDVPVGNGQAHVEVSDGHTRITTSDGGKTGDTSNTQSNKVDINMSSQNGGGTNWGSTQVSGSSYSSNNGSSSYNSTSIFSTGADHVSVSQQ